MKVIKLLFLLIIISLASSQAKAQDKEEDKIMQAVDVLNDFGKLREKIPAQLLQNTQGIIIIPKLINAGIGIGGKRGRGIAMIKGDDSTWSNPVFVTLSGGSIGFQIGVQSIDLVLVFRHKATLENIGKRTFTLGADASVAAGPVGRNSSASTDYKLEAEVYSYSKSRGLFAGISLSGSVLDVDSKANESFYKQQADAQNIFSGSLQTSDPSVTHLKSSLQNLYIK